jgi:hypothetical protein
VKGASSHDVNQHFSLRGKVLQWQAGYGVVTFGTKDLPWVKQYIRNQRQHHAAGKTSDRLERIAEDETPLSQRSPVNGADSGSVNSESVSGFAAPGINAGPNSG